MGLNWGRRLKRIFPKGELDTGVNSIGEAVGLINDTPTVKGLIDKIVGKAEAIVSKRIPSMVATSRK